MNIQPSTESGEKTLTSIIPNVSKTAPATKVEALRPFKVVIVGGGFGGVTACKYLKDNPQFEVTIVNRTNYFLFTPMLHEVATGGLQPGTVTEPIAEIGRASRADFVLGDVIKVDRINRFVYAGARSIEYDYLILATGSETNYYEIPGAREHTHDLKTLKDATDFKDRCITLFEGMALEDGPEELVFAVIGAGPTGVELITEMADFLRQVVSRYVSRAPAGKQVRLVLVNRDERMLSMYSKRIQDYARHRLNLLGVEFLFNKEVVRVEAGEVFFKDGSSLKAQTVVWVSGVKASDLPDGFENSSKDKIGRLIVNEYLQLELDPYVYAAGDCAAFTQNGSVLPMLAQVAARQGEYLGKNLERIVQGKQIRGFQYRSRGSFVSLGRFAAVGEIFGIPLTGFLAWFMWRTIYLFNFKSNKKRFNVAVEWTINLFYPRDITRLS
ncbi:MAG TPA: NAD(P)/FAD-dependent oxidoreductase [Patescibacteria group bacterium]|nr:NAD(P)/FAD-dependent oxidoreductase [Patescibacteria group bacterium]